MKVCSDCGLEKEFLEFTKKKSMKDGLCNYCKDCSRAIVRASYHKNPHKQRKAVSARNVKYMEEMRSFVKGQKSIGCFACEEKDVCCLDFHHIDPKLKFREVSNMVRERYSKSAILEEIEKCCVLCANCHRKFHGGSLEINFENAVVV